MTRRWLAKHGQPPSLVADMKHFVSLLVKTLTHP
jgi:hypothetical protein